MLRAVVVGIDRYLDPSVPDLACAAADARAVARLLESRIAPSEREVRLLLDGEATQRAILTSIGDDLHGTVERGDVVLLYFAGHGSPERIGARDKKSRYLLAHDTEFMRIHGTAIDMERDVADWFERLAEASLVVVVLDACFSGAAGGRSVMGPHLAANPVLSGFMADDPTPVSIKDLDFGRARVILCAADDGQLALEDARTGHGIFTRHLLSALTLKREDSVVPMTVLYDEVEQAVSSETKNRQQPIISLFRNKRAGLPSLA